MFNSIKYDLPFLCFFSSNSLRTGQQEVEMVPFSKLDHGKLLKDKHVLQLLKARLMLQTAAEVTPHAANSC